jgi:hypothetical protein
VTAWGAGTVLAGIIFARSMRRPLGVMLSVGVFALGAAFIGLSVAPTLALACVARSSEASATASSGRR